MDLQRCRLGLGATFPDLTHAADAVFFVQPGEDWLFIHQRLSFHNENNQLPSNYPMMRAESEKHFVPHREMFRTNIWANIGISEESLLKILYSFILFISEIFYWKLRLIGSECFLDSVWVLVNTPGYWLSATRHASVHRAAVYLWVVISYAEYLS